MKLKPLLAAVAVLAALALVAYVFQRPPARTPADARIGRPVLDPSLVERAARFELADQDKRVEIAKSGGTWVVASYFDLPADLAKLSQFVDDLSRAKVERLVTRDPARIARLEFKGAAITLADAAGRAVWKLALGKDAESGGRFVRFGEDPPVYLANLAVFLDTEPKSWADSQLLALKPEEITAVDLTFADGASLGVARARKEDPWKAEKLPAGRRLKGDRVDALLSSFANLRFEDTADPAAPDVTAARDHARTVRITTFAHQTFTIALGRRPPAPEAPRTEDRGQGGMKLEAPKPDAEAQGTGDRRQGGPKAEAPAQPSTQNPEPRTLNVPATPPPPPAPPPGPVYAFIASSDPAAPVNALMKRRAFAVYDWVFNGLPQKLDEFFEPVAPPPAAPATALPPAPGAAAPEPPAAVPVVQPPAPPKP